MICKTRGEKQKNLSKPRAINKCLNKGYEVFCSRFCRVEKETLLIHFARIMNFGFQSERYFMFVDLRLVVCVSSIE